MQGGIIRLVQSKLQILSITFRKYKLILRFNFSIGNKTRKLNLPYHALILSDLQKQLIKTECTRGICLSHVAD